MRCTPSLRTFAVLEPDRMTPLEALSVVYSLRALADEA